MRRAGPRRAQAADVGARAGVDVVVELEVADAQVADQEVDHLVQVLDRGGVAQVQVVAAVLDHALAAPRWKNASAGSWSATGLRTPTTSGSSHRPGTMPVGPDAVEHLGDAAGEPGAPRASTSPTVSHQPSPGSAYQPASMQKYSAPTSAAAAISGSSRSVVGSPISVFM